jgi:hypothetical protein
VAWRLWLLGFVVCLGRSGVHGSPQPPLCQVLIFATALPSSCSLQSMAIRFLLAMLFTAAHSAGSLIPHQGRLQGRGQAAEVPARSCPSPSQSHRSRSLSCTRGPPGGSCQRRQWAKVTGDRGGGRSWVTIEWALRQWSECRWFFRELWL